MNLGSFINFSIFLIFSHFEWLVFGVSSGLLYVVWWLFGLGFDIKTEADQAANHIKQPTGDPEHQPLKMRKNEKN